MTRPSRLLSAQTLPRALAEVAIIVAGVLIALGADAWWTKREDESLRQEYILRLAQDVDADRSHLEITADREDGRTLLADRLIEWMESPTEPPRDSLRRTINGIRGGSIGPLRTGTWQDLSSTGRLSLIEDQRVRLWLLRYYDFFVPSHNAGLVVYEEQGFWPLSEAMTPHLDDRVVYAHLWDDSEARMIKTSWDAFRGDREVLSRLQRISAMAGDEARWRRQSFGHTVDCFRLALHDAGAPWEVEPEYQKEVRDRCTRMES